jgi:hypothetical protein
LVCELKRPAITDPEDQQACSWDLFGYRWAFRCTTDASSDVILGHGWASEDYTAAHIDPTSRGVGWLIVEGGTPRRMKAAYRTADPSSNGRGRGRCGMNTLTLTGPGSCPQSADRRPHTWRSGDSADLISFGKPDHGVSAYLGRCRYCVVPMLAVAKVSEDLRGAGPVLEYPGPIYDPDSHPPTADRGGDRQPGRPTGFRPVGRAGHPMWALLPPGSAAWPRRTSISHRPPGLLLNGGRAGSGVAGPLREPAGGGVPVVFV